jgi:hypothetical protein
MNQRATRHYKRLREKNWPAREACRAAKAKAAFEDMEHAGFARLRVEPDDSADLSYLGQKGFEDILESEHERANKLGMWGIIVECRNPLAGEDGPWEHVDSCWGFIGDDWKDSGYDTDFYENAIDWLSQFEGMPA